MQRRKIFFRWISGWLLLSMLGGGIWGGAVLSVRAAPKQQTLERDVIINEIAWGGTVGLPSTDEWIELYNTTYNPIDFNGEWILTTSSDPSTINNNPPPNVKIVLSGSIAGKGYYLLERQNDSVIKTILADQLYYGPGNVLDDGGDTLYLYAPDGADYIKIDTANSNGGPWPAGNAAGFGSMERYGKYEDSDSIWVTNSNPDTANLDFRDNPIYGTPRYQNWATTITPISKTTITSVSPSPSIPNLAVTVSVNVIGGPDIPTGTVAITGGSQSCNITLSNGSGSCNLNFATLGSKTITATYSGDPKHTPSNDSVTHQVVTGVTTTTTISGVSPDIAFVNSPVRVTVNVATSSGSSKPTGNVNITGATKNCNITLSNGVGACDVEFSTIGVKTITANYSGDGAFIASSDTETVDVYLPSTVTITADTPDPSTTNRQVTVSVEVTGDGNTPTGSVDITGANSNCSIVLTDGAGSCNVNFYSSGTKTIKATYNGDDIYSTSFDTETHTVSFTTQSSGNTTTTVITPILGISEFLPRPGYDWNNDGSVDVFDEFIEIINAGQIAVNLNAYRLDDEANLGSSPYSLPNLTLQPGERAVFYGSETGILLSDAGDTVRLLKGNTVIDAYTYGVVGYPNQAWCRIPDRLGYWNDPCFPTPNNPNSLTGTVPLPSGPLASYLPPVCLLPDTTPEVFVYAECEEGGNGIWNRQFWDKEDDTKKLILDVDGRWETIFE